MNAQRALAGRVALVTGGGRGIGRAICKGLAADGAIVAVNYRRDEASAQNVVNEILENGGRAVLAPAAVDERTQCDSMIASLEAQFGGIGILVNNAGIASRGNSVVDTDPIETERVMRVHALAAEHLCRLVIPSMRRELRGDVVMVSSVSAHLLPANGAPYNMAKAALEALAHTLAKEEADHGIHVNMVAPGLVTTEMGDRLARAMTAGEHWRASDLDEQSPFGHVCRPEDVADVIRFLVSDRASYLTGQRIVIDGGAHPHRP